MTLLCVSASVGFSLFLSLRVHTPCFFVTSCYVQVLSVDVSGRGRRLHRRVGLNRLQDVAFCWWNLDEPGDELWPWTPTDAHRNNLVLLSCSPAEGLKVTHTHTHLPTNQLV